MTRPPLSRRLGGWGALVLVLAILVLAAEVPAAGATSPMLRSLPLGTRAGTLRPAASPPTDNVSYASSVDAFPLSYLEWLPTGYDPASSYPLAVFLHGVGSSTTWIPGGGGGSVDMTASLVDNASTDGFLLIAINTRSPEGFYINSPCGGPQEQDVLDAIGHEEGLRHVTSVYLIGFSMGSLGAFSIAGHHPGMFAGIATAGTISDIYETVAYNDVTNSAPKGLFDDLCGDHPSPANASTDRVWTSLSVLRFDPQNFSGIPLFAIGGGLDTRAPDNFARWNYANVNNTFLNATCAVATSLGEPANCTVPIPTLAQQDPAHYRWLDLYEPLAPHSPNQFPGSAVFGFFLNRQPGGYYLSPYPGGALTPYSPGTPIDLPHTMAQGLIVPPWAVVLLLLSAGVVVAAAVAAIVVSRRRAR